MKNSGHDFIGRSSAPNSLSIWVHRMKGITAHPEGFRPAGCNITIEGHAITAAAGTQMLETYRATALMNRTVVGGNGRTVALGGFITGGGHSILAPHFGMAADQVLELELVTPGGEILKVNECQNTDLFWAMRGVSSPLISPGRLLLTCPLGRRLNLWRAHVRHPQDDPQPRGCDHGFPIHLLGRQPVRL